MQARIGFDGGFDVEGGRGATKDLQSQMSLGQMTISVIVEWMDQ
jgi:hypothetical protein